MAKDERKYQVVHIPTNVSTAHSSMQEATKRARAIDAMILSRRTVASPYQFICEYRYGKKK